MPKVPGSFFPGCKFSREVKIILSCSYPDSQPQGVYRRPAKSRHPRETAVHFNSKLLGPLALLITSDSTVFAKYHALFVAAGYQTERARNMQDAMHLIDHALPHLILTDAFLVDGHAGKLYDLLKEQRIKQKIPILVHLGGRNAKDLGVLQNRHFAAFFTGDPLPKAFTAKIREIEHQAFDPPIYWLKASRFCPNDEQLRIRLKSVLLGLHGNFLVFKSKCRPPNHQQLRFVPGAPHQGANALPVELVLKTVGGYYIFVPREAVADVPWTQNIAVLTPPTKAAKPPDLPAPPPRRVLFYHPDRNRMIRVSQLLNDPSVEFVYAQNLRVAAKIYDDERGRFGVVFLHELLTDRAKELWIKSYEHHSDQHKTNLIVGTIDQPPVSTKQVMFLQQPLDNKSIEGALLAFLNGRADQEYPYDFSTSAKSIIPCALDLDARLIGVTESALIIEHDWLVLDGTEVKVASRTLLQLFKTALKSKVAHSENHPERAGRFISRLPWSETLGAKADLFKKLQDSIQRGEGVEEKSEKPKETPFNAAVINTFIQSTYEVIEYYTGELPKLEKPQVATSQQSVAQSQPWQKVEARCQVDGEKIAGHVTINADPSFVAALAFRISGTPKDEALGDKEALREVIEALCDQIFGKARLMLHSLGYPYEVSLPTVTFAEEQKPELTPDAKLVSILLPFVINNKRFEIVVMFVVKS